MGISLLLRRLFHFCSILYWISSGRWDIWTQGDKNCGVPFAHKCASWSVTPEKYWKTKKPLESFFVLSHCLRYISEMLNMLKSVTILAAECMWIGCEGKWWKLLIPNFKRVYLFAKDTFEIINYNIQDKMKRLIKMTFASLNMAYIASFCHLIFFLFFEFKILGPFRFPLLKQWTNVLVQ